MPGPITPDIRAIIEAAHLVFAATVTPNGQPNLSPKGTIRVWDDAHVFFLDIASPRTRENLRLNPAIELNVVDQTSRRGYRLRGRATLHTNDDIYARATSRVFAEEGATFPVACVVLIRVEHADALISPGYLHTPDEWSMRAAWSKRRPALDAAFEEHIRKHGPVTGEPRP